MSRPVANQMPASDPPKATALQFESNRRAARAAIKQTITMYHGADWETFSRTFAWFQHSKRMDESAQKWFELTWREIHKQLYAPGS